MSKEDEEVDLATAIAQEAAILEGEAEEAEGVEEEITAEAEEEVEEAIEETEDTEEPVEESVEEVAEATEEENEGLEPLEHWSQDVKDAFEKVDPEGQQAWIDQHKTFQRGYNELVESNKEAVEFQQEYSEVGKTLKEFEPLWRAQGMNVAQGVGQLTQWAYALASNPSEVLPQLAQMYGVELGELENDNKPYVAPEDKARDARMNQLEGRLQQQDAAQATEHQNKLIGQIEAFRDTTDADGNQENVHFDSVIDQMTDMYQKGFVGSLDQAYEQACWTNPEVRQQMIQGVEVKTNKKTSLQRQNDAKRARKATNQRVRQSKPAASSDPTDDLSLEELIQDLADKQVANG